MDTWKIFSVLVAFAFGFHAHAQAPMRKLPQNINRPNVNVTIPFISLDGNTLLLTSDYGDQPAAYYSQKVGANWNDPKPLPKHVSSNLNFPGSYTLSADGSTMYLTSIKSGGVGGYDIWSSNLLATSWNAVQNMYLPINTTAHEGCPTFTTDGKVMYFMRCVTMNQQGAEGCKIMVSRKAANGKWEEPVELPPHINTGNSQFPRISADEDILIFASDKIEPTKGGFDLFVSRFKNGSWSNPVALDIVNTEQDDQYISLIANGRYILKDADGKFSREIIEYLVPEAWRPPASMKVTGVVSGPDGNPVSAYISVVDISTETRVYSGRPEKDGSYFFYLKEGSTYELVFDPEDSHYTYFSKTIDMSKPGNPLTLSVNTTLKPVQIGDTLDLQGISFNATGTTLEKGNAELRRLSRLMKVTPQLSYELHVSLVGYDEDTLRSNSDLTELRVDSVYLQLEQIDSLGNHTSRDSLIIETIFHNNRTEKQAQTLVNELQMLGIEHERLFYSTDIKTEEIAEKRKLIIRVIVRNKTG